MTRWGAVDTSVVRPGLFPASVCLFRRGSQQLHIRCTLGLRRNGFTGSIPPKPLQIVKLPLFFVKDVGNHVDVIEKHPLPVIRPLHMPGPFVTRFTYRLAYCVRDGLDLQVGITRAYNEVIGHATYLAHIQYGYIVRLLIQHGIDHVRSQNVRRILS